MDKIIRSTLCLNRTNLIRTSARCFSSAEGKDPKAESASQKAPEGEALKAVKSSSKDLSVAEKYCRDQVKKFDFYSFVAGHYMPKATQQHYFGFHALFLEAMKSREVSREVSICQTRLNWWEENLKEIYEYTVNPQTEKQRIYKPKEPVSVLLKDALQTTHINYSLLQRIVNFQLFDIERGDMMTINELEVYAENTRSMLLYLNLHLLRIDDSNALTAASHLGRCLGICDVIKKTPFYLGMNRGYIPQDILIRNNVHFDNMWSKNFDGIMTEEFFDVILEVAAYAKKHLEICKSMSDKLPKGTHLALLLAIEAEKFLDDLETANFNIFDDQFRKKSVMKLPYKLYKAAKAGTY